VLDLILADGGDSPADLSLRQALAESAPLHVTLTATPQPPHQDRTVPTQWLYSFLPPAVLPEPVPRNVSVASPVAFDPGGTLDGALLLRPDGTTGKAIPHLSFSAVLGRYGVPLSDATWDPQRGLVTAGSLSWPVGADG